MDCAAEERLVRMALDRGPAIRNVDVDLAEREVTIIHEDDVESVSGLLSGLNLGARLIESGPGRLSGIEVPSDDRSQTSTLRIVLAINAAMFVGEAVGAFLADSTALLADSLDMFADAAVYGIALFAENPAADSRPAG